MSSQRMFLKLKHSVFVISTVISLSSLQTRGAIIGTIWAEAAGQVQASAEKDQAEKRTELLRNKRVALKDEIAMKFHTALDLIKSTRGVVPKDEVEVFACIEKFGTDNSSRIENIEAIDSESISVEAFLIKLKGAHHILLEIYEKTEPFFKNEENRKNWKTAIDEIKGEESILAIKAILDKMATKDQDAIDLATKRLMGITIYESLLGDLKSQEDQKPPMTSALTVGLVRAINGICVSAALTMLGVGIPMLVGAVGGVPGIIVSSIGGLVLFLDAPRPSQGMSGSTWSDLDPSVAQLFQMHMAAKCPENSVVSFVEFTMEDFIEFVKEFKIDEDQQETLIDLIGLSE